MHNKAEDISDVLLPEAFNKLKVGTILVFTKDGQRIEMKITKINKKNKLCLAKQVRTYSPDEVKVIDKVKK